MFTKWEKVALVITGLELVVIHIGFKQLRKQVDERSIRATGLTIDELMKARTKREYDELVKNRKA